MVIVLDENVSVALTAALRQVGHKVIAVAETAERGMADTEVWELAKAERAVLITRDHGFTKWRRGNLSSEEGVALVIDFLAAHELDEYKGCLVTLWPGGARIRC